MSEIEDCLMQHPAVGMVAVVGVPDEVRGEAVEAFVQLVPGQPGSASLATKLQDHVRARLSAHEYPKWVEFVDSLPLTTTGKVRRNVLRERHVAGR